MLSFCSLSARFYDKIYRVVYRCIMMYSESVLCKRLGHSFLEREAVCCD